MLKINMTHHYHLLCPLYNHVEALCIIIMNECLKFIFQLFHILNLPTLVVLTPPHSPYTPSANYANASADYVNSYVDSSNTFVDHTDFSINYANKSNDCVNTLDDWVNTFADSANTLDKLTSNLYIPKPSLL
jgi:hypothetical protein